MLKTIWSVKFVTYLLQPPPRASYCIAAVKVRFALHLDDGGGRRSYEGWWWTSGWLMTGSQPCRNNACRVGFKEGPEPLVERPEVYPVGLTLFRRHTADIGTWLEGIE